jgi:hypothetical protein
MVIFGRWREQILRLVSGLAALRFADRTKLFSAPHEWLVIILVIVGILLYQNFLHRRLE